MWSMWIAIVCLQRWHTHQLVKALVKPQMNHILLYWLATSGSAHRRMTKPPLIKHYFCHESQLHAGLKIPAHSCIAGVICFLNLYYLTLSICSWLDLFDILVYWVRLTFHQTVCICNQFVLGHKSCCLSAVLVHTIWVSFNSPVVTFKNEWLIRYCD